MKRILALLIALFLAASVFALPSFAGTLDEIQKRGVLRVGMEPGYMPFELTNKKGEIVGFDVDMAKRMAKAMDVKLELVSTAWDGIIPALLTNKFDIIMSGMTLTQQRNMKINFAHPYIVIGQTILLKKSLAGEVKSYSDLNNKKYTVASKLGTTGEQATKRMIPKAKYISYGPARASSAPLVSTHAELGIEMKPHMPTDPNNAENTFLYNYEFWADYRDDMDAKFQAWLAK